MMVEAYTTMEKTMDYYGTLSKPVSDFPFNFLLITNLKNRSDINGINLRKSIETWLNNTPKRRWPNWVVSLWTYE